MKTWMWMVMAAGMALAWEPGTDYAGGGGTHTNSVYDPLTGRLYPWQPNVQVLGRVNTNDVAIFTDRSGRYVRATNVLTYISGLAPQAINEGMSNYLAAVQAVATNSYAVSTNALAWSALAYDAGTNGQAVAALGYVAGTNGLAWSALAYLTATNAESVSALAWSAATNAEAQVATVYPASTNAAAVAVLAYDAGTNGAAVAAVAYVAATNAEAQVATVYPTSTNAATVAGLAYVAATNGSAVALAALATYAETSTVSRVYVTTNLWWDFYGGGTQVLVSIYYDTNTFIKFSSDFKDTVDDGTLYPLVLEWPFNYEGWEGYVGDYYGTPVNLVQSPNISQWWGAGPSDYLTAYSSAEGDATIFQAGWTTNTTVYVLGELVTAETISPALTNAGVYAQITTVSNIAEEALLQADIATGQAASGIALAGTKLDRLNGTGTNLTVLGTFTLPQSQATNLVLRLKGSNEYLVVEEVWQ